MNPLYPEQDAAAVALGTALRDAAMAQVDAAAPPDWRSDAEQAVLYVARRRERFTTDAVWAVLDNWLVAQPPEPRALGPLMKSACSWGWCEPTPVWHLSVRPACHRRPVRVYRSLVFV